MTDDKEIVELSRGTEVLRIDNATDADTGAYACVVGNARANFMGTSKLMEPFHMVATQLNTFTPVGTAIIIVAYMKNSSPASGMPTVNMWCAQTMNDRKAMLAVAYTMEL